MIKVKSPGSAALPLPSQSPQPSRLAAAVTSKHFAPTHSARKHRQPVDLLFVFQAAPPFVYQVGPWPHSAVDRDYEADGPTGAISLWPDHAED